MKTTNVLVVDNGSELKFLVTRKFERRIQAKELQFFFAGDGLEALRHLEVTSGISVVFSDLYMPRMDGLTLLSHLREQYPRLCTIIIIPGDDMQNIRMAMNRGAYDFLLKPVNVKDLEATLNKAIRHITRRTRRGTELKRAEKAVVRERNLLRTLIDVMPDLIYVKDIRGRFLLNNKASLRALGSPPTAFGKTDFDFFPAELAEQYSADEQGIIQSGQPLINRMEPNPNYETGEMRWVLTTKAPVRDHQDKVVALVGINRDITELKQLAEALQTSEQQYRLLVERVGDGIAIVREGKVLFVNEALCSIFGETVDQLLRMNPIALVQDDEKNPDGEGSEPTGNETPESLWHLQHTTRDGREIWIETRQCAIQWEGSPALLVTVRDITEHKRREMICQQEGARLRKENLALRASIKERGRFGDIVGRSLAMQQVYELILRAAATDKPVVIFGESGTGKELIARTIHKLSPRSDHTFVAVNCGAIPGSLFESELFGHRKGAFTGAYTDKPGLFEMAHQGTLFLDEVAELSPPLQVKLLRSLENGEYMPVGSHTSKRTNVRIIAATNRNLLKQVKEGQIREDFFYRLHVLEIRVPPLRKRKEDLPLLIEHFLKPYVRTKPHRSLPEEILKQLYAYHWPGNIRELQNVLCRYMTTHQLSFASTREPEPGTSYAISRIPGEPGGDQTLREALEDFEKRYILDILDHHQGHRAKAAAALGIPERTLYRKLKKYQLI